MDLIRSGNLKNVGMVVLAVVVVIIVAILLVRPTSVELTFPGGTARLAGTSISHDSVLAKIWDEDFARAGLLGWLAEKNIFHIEDVRVVDALNNELCDPIPGQPLQDRIEAQQTCAEVSVASGLRELRESRRIPFHYVGRVVRIGVPTNGPRTGQAWVCRNSEFLGKTVELTILQTGKQIEVVAAGGVYNCTDVGNFPHLQLNREDAANLFPSALEQYQEAIAIVVD